MEVIYRLGRASAAEIRDALVDPPTYTAVRTHLTLLEGKNHIKHCADGNRYIYEPVVPREEMGKRMILGVVRNFFDDSIEQLVAALVTREQSEVSDDQLGRLANIIAQARKEGR